MGSALERRKAPRVRSTSAAAIFRRWSRIRGERSGTDGARLSRRDRTVGPPTVLLRAAVFSVIYALTG